MWRLNRRLHKHGVVPHVFHDDRIEIRFDLPDSLDIGPIMEARLRDCGDCAQTALGDMW